MSGMLWTPRIQIKPRDYKVVYNTFSISPKYSNRSWYSQWLLNALGHVLYLAVGKLLVEKEPQTDLSAREI